MTQEDQTIDALIQKHEGSWQAGYAAFPERVCTLGLRIGVEVGVAFGGHARAIIEQGGVDKLYGVDSYQHRDGYDDPMNLPQPVFDRLAQRVVDRLSTYKNRFELIREDSASAGNRFDDGSLDFVYLDADHSEEGVWQDLCTWAIKVRAGGIIAGHDYGHPDFPGVKNAIDRFFSRFGWRVNEAGHGVWWVQRKQLPITYFTPCYNCERWIRESAESILNGNIAAGDEYILVDDGSSDATAKVLAQIAEQYSAVRIITHPTNKGGSAARDTAIAAAKNPLCFCLDSDNIIVSGSVSPLRDHLLRSGTDTVGFQTLRYFTDDGGTDQVTHELVYEPVITDFARCIHTTSIPSGSGNYLFTREAWQRAGGYPRAAGALDAWGFGIRKAATGSTATILPGSFYYHRHGHESYWIRHRKEGSVDQSALDVLRPFLHLIEPRDVKYLLSEKGSKRWLTDLNRRPLRLLKTNHSDSIKPIIKTGLLNRLRQLVERAA